MPKDTYERIPPVLSLYRIKPDGKFIFPGFPVPLRARSRDDSDHSKLLKQSFIVFTAAWSEKTLTNVGVLGKVVSIEDPPGQKTLCFKGIQRVHFHVVPDAKYQEERVQWILFDEYRGSRQRESKIILRKVRGLFREYCERMEGARAPHIKEFFALQHVKSIIQFIHSADERFAALIADHIMNFVNYCFLPEDDPGLIIRMSLRVIQEKDSLTRLSMAEFVLRGLVHGYSDDMAGDIPIEDMSDDDWTPVPVSHQKEVPGKTNHIHELLKHREISPRFPALETKQEPGGERIRLEHKKASKFGESFYDFSSQYIIGHSRAKRLLATKLVRFKQLGASDRATCGGIFVGPPGAGKTALFQVVALFLFNDPDGFTRIDGGSFSEKIKEGNMFGGSRNFIGYDDPLQLSQWGIDRPHFLKILRDTRKDFPSIRQEVEFYGRNLMDSRTAGRAIRELKKLGYRPGEYLSLILFDEFDQIHPRILRVLMPIFDAGGKLQLPNGNVTSFYNSLVGFTSNLSGSELIKEITGIGKIGIRSETKNFAEETEKRYWKIIKGSTYDYFAKRGLMPFLSRLGKENIIGFPPHAAEENQGIVKLNLEVFRRKILSLGIDGFALSDAVADYILKEIQDPINLALGARALEKVFNRIEDSVLNLLQRGSEGDESALKKGDWVYIDMEEDEIIIERKRPMSA